ncbi:MAG TPA: Ppx/GppA phosphatase family protein [Solirubrobacteraceae bacterium]|jgi:exopolyphosphatase/guanosine-5'-triphosphate,3'-diphosphate pyrophosphatase|nr:Ppx/GppA phosphatase family protein [Solirubrobacteraceae bacterium]
MKPGERAAVIDLGSNSFRLVVFMAGDHWWKRTDEIYEPVRIGEGLAATGRLGDEPIERALATLDVFSHFLRASGLGEDSVDAVATSAIRDAGNAESFLERARARFGLPIRVLSRETEARYGYLAAVNSTTLENGYVFDLGGGSMQLVRVEDRLARESGSWPLGTVRMSERFLPANGPAKRKQLDELREHLAGELAGAPWLTAGEGTAGGRRLVGIGGTVRNLAAAAQRATGLPSNGVQGTMIELDVLEELVQRLAALPASERASVPGVKPARADLILAGAVVVQAVLKAGGFEGMETTEAGLREGIFYERLLSDRSPSPDRPPLLENVREASVLNLAAQYRSDGEHTRHVAALALGMFDELAELGLHEGDRLERELLWAASMLHDIGMSIDYDDHHKHSRYLILNGGLPGYSPVETAIIAQAARYHRKGMPVPGPMAALFNEGDAERLDRCAVLLRLAEDLERSRDQLVRRTTMALTNGEVELHLVADGEPAVPRWAAGRETELFARAFHRGLSVAA